MKCAIFGSSAMLNRLVMVHLHPSSSLQEERTVVFECSNVSLAQSFERCKLHPLTSTDTHVAHIDIPYKTQNSCTVLRPLCNLKPHLGAAIRCLEWSYTDSAHSYLLFTGGAIESMRVWQVSMSIPNSYQVQFIEDHSGRVIPEHTPLSLGCLELAQCPHVSEKSRDSHHGSISVQTERPVSYALCSVRVLGCGDSGLDV